MSAAPASPARVRLVEVGSLRLRVSERGEGPPLLLITGIGASLDIGVPLEMQLAAAGLRVISYDAPGIGASTNYRLPTRMGGVASTITRMLDVLGYDCVDVFGISLGGAVAQQLAHDAPGRVRKLVLAATTCGVGVPGSPRVLISLATPRRYVDRAYARRIAGRIYGGRARHDPDLVLGEAFGRVTPPSPLGYLGQLYAVAGWTSIWWIGSLAQETLVLHGDDDPIVPLINGRFLARLVPKATLQVMHGGHLFVLEQPEVVAETVHRFLGPGL